MAQLYDTIGTGYAAKRQPDPRIAAMIHRELPLQDAGRIVNIGAGTGSYEPWGASVVAVEPSQTMLDQRPPGAAPAVRAVAEALPFADRSFDAALAVMTIHHWNDIGKGLGEARRVADRVVLLTWMGFPTGFWILDYFPNLGAYDARRFPGPDALAGWLGPVREIHLPIPADCTDGFLCAYWRRPHRYLDEGVRRGISSFSRIKNLKSGLDRLAADLESGQWHARYGCRLPETAIDLGYRLMVSG